MVTGGLPAQRCLRALARGSSFCTRSQGPEVWGPQSCSSALRRTSGQTASVHPLLLPTHLPARPRADQHLDQSGEMPPVPPSRVEPGEVQPIKATRPQERWHRSGESPATLGVGSFFGKSGTKITPEECLALRCWGWWPSGAASVREEQGAHAPRPAPQQTRGQHFSACALAPDAPGFQAAMSHLLIKPPAQIIT